MAFQHFRLSDLSVRNTQTLGPILVAKLIYLFIASCMLHVSYMYNFTETSFSVFYFYYYCLREPEK